MPTVSILLPCYNAAETLEQALQSLQQQSLTDFEVIAVDDGSDDQSLQILNAWCQRDSRFKVIPIEHGGIIAALNTGFNFCRANYIARMDADDRCHPQRLEKQIDYLESHPQAALVSCLVAGFPTQNVREGFRIYLDWLNSLVTDAQIRREIFVESPLPHPSVTIRREWLQQVGGYQEHGWPEDYDLWLRMYLAGAQFAKLPEVLLDWREHPERLTRTDGRYSVENFLRAKAHYLARGPLKNRDAVIIWGAGMMGRRLGKQLQRQEVSLKAFVDIDPKKIGRQRRGRPIIAPDTLLDVWARYDNPVILAAVGARGARLLIRERLNQLGLVEGRDWWSAA